MDDDDRQEKLEKEAEKAGRQAGDVMAREVGRAFGNAFEGAIVRDKPFKQVFRSLLQDVQSTLLHSVVETGIGSLIGRGSNGDDVADFFKTIVQAFTFAEGGVMGGRGPLPLARYARGGVADSPQMAVFGEGRAPEAFVPLPDGRRIPVRMEGGGGGVSVVNNITVHAADAASFRRAEGQVGAEIAARLQRHLRRNG